MRFSTEFSCNYPGVVSADIRSFPGMRVGPNTMGEFFTPRLAVYNPETRTTRVTFALIPKEKKA